jgi:hypothetical protein
MEIQQRNLHNNEKKKKKKKKKLEGLKNDSIFSSHECKINLLRV